jgi:transposase
MKKNSKQSKRVVEADLTKLKDVAAGELVIGIDIGDRYSEICVLDRQGLVVQRGRIRTEGRAMHDQFSQLARQRVAMETGTHSPWLYGVLVNCGHEVMVANARKVRLITESDRKSDGLDAYQLGDLARTNPRLLHPIQPRSMEAQDDLAMIRARESLVETRTGLINHVRGVVKSHGERLSKCDSKGFAMRVGEQIPEGLKASLSGVLGSLDAVDEEIQGYECQLEHLALKKYPETALMKQINGVGTITALAFRLVIDDPHRFVEGRRVGAYLGLVPRRRQSGDRDPELGISKAGDELLRKLLVNCAHHILGPHGADSALRRWGLKLIARGGKKARKRAATAVARKLAVLMHHLWVSGEVYEPMRGCAMASAPAAA